MDYNYYLVKLGLLQPMVGILSTNQREVYLFPTMNKKQKFHGNIARSGWIMITYHNLKIPLGLVVHQRTYLEGLSYGLLIQGENRWFQLVLTGWWFGIFFIFPYIRNNHPNWRTHIFQRGRYTTNQLTSFHVEPIGAFSMRWWLSTWLSLLETYPVACSNIAENSMF